MDPFTQRMRERARLRKEKASGSAPEDHEAVIRSPLKDQNHTHTVKITTEEVTISKPRKEVKQIDCDLERENETDSMEEDVPTTAGKRAEVRDRLQRLGALYSGSPCKLSSPIHRTEQDFFSEPIRAQKAPARSARLAALADTINQWEDDVGHSVNQGEADVREVDSAMETDAIVAVPTVSAGMTRTSSAVVVMTGSSVAKPTAKTAAWDSKLLQSLEGQGFARSKSNARLEFDFQNKETASKPASTKEAWLNAPVQSRATKEAWPGSPGQSQGSPSRGGSCNSSPEKRPPGLKSVSPRKAANPTGAVFQKAQLFEPGSPRGRERDPAELSLVERTALFEKVRGDAPLPRCPFGTPLPRVVVATPAKPVARAIIATSPDKKLANRSPQKAGNAASDGWTPQRIGNPAAVGPVQKSGNVGPSVQKPEKSGNSVVGVMQQMFEAGGGGVAHQTIHEKAATERKNELDMLLNRWQRRGNDTSDPPPPPPPMPSAPSMSEIRPPTRENSPLPSASPASPGNGSPPRRFPSVSKIRVSPPKPGRLYPCLSDIDASATELESEDSRSLHERSSEMDSSLDAGETSFGRSILAAVSRSAQRGGVASAGAQSDSDSEDGPTPPKKTRHHRPGNQEAEPCSVSHSFKYRRGNEEEEEEEESQGQQAEAPLLHTVSFYRRQQSAGSKSPVKQLVRSPEKAVAPSGPGQREQVQVSAKISWLLEEVGRQQTVISQASQALNLCHATVEFNGSQEAVEAERLLLLATHRRQAALNEVQRLKVEGSLKPLTEFGQTVELSEKGVLTLKDIALPLKRDFLRNMDSDSMAHHFLVLAKYQEQVVGTLVCAGSRDLVFPGPLRLVELYSDFKLRLEVYTLQARKEVLPHELKYHIHSKKDSKGRLTPKKRAESRLVMPPIQSPAGPGAVRSPAFQMAGFVVFSLKELRRTSFTLNTVSPGCPLEGQVRLRLESQLSLNESHRGFLTVFEDVSGFGAWHRRWCLLQGAALSFWKYPDDEKKKVPLGCIELSCCETRQAALVSRDVCARPNTFLLETSRDPLPGDRDSLVLSVCVGKTVLRHLLSADTKEDRVEWCDQINKALGMLRAWTK